MSHESDKHDPEDIDCLEAIDQLYAYLHGEVDDVRERGKLEHHLGHCRSCFTRSQMERELNERIKDAEKDKTPESLQKRLHDLMRSF